MNQDHVVGGGVATVVATNLPPVLAYFQGAAAPVNQETAVLIVLAAALYAGIRLLFNRCRPAPAPGAA